MTGTRKLFAAGVFFILLSGCNGLFGFWMNGNPAVGKNITPTRDEWRLPVGTSEERIRDWVDCGGTESGGYHTAMPGWESGKRYSYQETALVSHKKFDDLQICMMKKGYQYIGTCEGEVPSTYRACREESARQIIN